MRGQRTEQIGVPRQCAALDEPPQVAPGLLLVQADLGPVLRRRGVLDGVGGRLDAGALQSCN